MRRKAPLLILALALTAALTPGLFLNVHAVFGCRTQPGNTCNLEADANVPAADGVVRVSITQLGGGVYNGQCPASCFNLNHTWALGNGTRYFIRVLNPVIIGAVSGNRYNFSQWIYSGNGQPVGQAGNVTMKTTPLYGNYSTATCSGGFNCPFEAKFVVLPTLGCYTNCNLDALTTVPSSDGTIRVSIAQVGGTSSGYNGVCPASCFNLPHTWALPNGTSYTIKVLNNITGAPSGANYVWQQWDCTGSCPSVSGPTISQTLATPTMYFNYTVSGVGAFTARFDKQYPLSLTFADQNGNPLAAPTSLQLISGTTVVNMTSFSSVYESAQVWTIKKVVWEGITGVEIAGQTVDLTSAGKSATITLEAYQAAVKAIDNSNNPISGANVTVTFSNSTMRTFKTNSQGLVQLGEMPCFSSGNSWVCVYKATVTYNGQTSSSCCIDASNSQNNPYVVQLNVGSSPVTTPLVSAAVLLAIFGLAAFLVIIAVFVRKPARPPQIDTSPP